jgi:hypothetical protein
LNAYQGCLSNPATLLDPMGTETVAEREARLWKGQEGRAQKAFDFWNDFLNLRMGNDANGPPMSKECKERFMALIRAMSWVESEHGDGAGNQPARDPMQSGNPNDKWWQGITGMIAPDRIIRGPGKQPNFNLNQVPGATGLGAPAKGHQSPQFTPDLSYYWGVLGLIHKTNNGPKGGGKTYRCGECSWEQLIEGAVKYNGNPNINYEERVRSALKLFGSGPQ